MHPNPIFRKTEEQDNFAFARQRGFGILAVSDNNGPLLSHIPFLLNEDNTILEAHLVRSNPILDIIAKPVNAVIAVSGPDSYVSPDWYRMDDQVPTWNYVSVHLRGNIVKLPDNQLLGHLERLSEFFENQLAPKSPWKIEKMEDRAREKMLRMIVPVQMKIMSIDGTWKLGQNKPDDVRLRASNEMAKYGIGMETAGLAAMMKELPS